MYFRLADVNVGFTESNYTFMESAGARNVCIILSGALERSVFVDVSTIEVDSEGKMIIIMIIEWTWLDKVVLFFLL